MPFSRNRVLVVTGLDWLLLQAQFVIKQGRLSNSFKCFPCLYTMSRIIVRPSPNTNKLPGPMLLDFPASRVMSQNKLVSFIN